MTKKHTLKISVGDVFKINDGGTITILEFNGCRDVIAIHNDKHGHTFKTTSSNIRSGQIRNPYKPSAFNVGYIGHGIYHGKKDGVTSKSYVAWHGMLRRCYHEGFSGKHKTYDGCSVASEWHNFQVFSDWFYSQRMEEGWEVDKDILIKGNKIYSPANCRMVPLEINTLMRPVKEKNGMPVGVRRSGSKYKAYISDGGKNKYIGTFPCKESASRAYKEEKVRIVRCTAERYKGRVCDDIYYTLINYAP